MARIKLGWLTFPVLSSWIAFLPGQLHAQLTEKQLLDLIATQSLREARLRVNEVAARYPDSPVALYFQALLESDANKAIEKYKRITERHPESVYSVKATYRLGQFYFARGFYYSARKYFLDVVQKQAPRAMLDGARYSAAKCLYAAGKLDSARSELEALRQTTTSQLYIALIDEDLQALRERATLNAAISEGASGSHTESGTGKIYTIQIGSYQQYENALSQKKYFSLLGYPVEIRTFERGEATFYRVLIGKFSSREVADRFGRAFKKKFAMNYRIVKLQSSRK